MLKKKVSRKVFILSVWKKGLRNLDLITQSVIDAEKKGLLILKKKKTKAEQQKYVNWYLLQLKAEGKVKYGNKVGRPKIYKTKEERKVAQKLNQRNFRQTRVVKKVQKKGLSHSPR
jgi:hypothetical protein